MTDIFRVVHYATARDFCYLVSKVYGRKINIASVVKNSDIGNDPILKWSIAKQDDGDGGQFAIAHRTCDEFLRDQLDFDKWLEGEQDGLTPPDLDRLMENLCDLGYVPCGTVHIHVNDA